MADSSYLILRSVSNGKVDVHEVLAAEDGQQEAATKVDRDHRVSTDRERFEVFERQDRVALALAPASEVLHPYVCRATQTPGQHAGHAAAHVEGRHPTYRGS